MSALNHVLFKRKLKYTEKYRVRFFREKCRMTLYCRYFTWNRSGSDFFNSIQLRTTHLSHFLMLSAFSLASYPLNDVGKASFVLT